MKEDNWTGAEILEAIKNEMDHDRMVAVSTIHHDKKSRFPLKNGKNILVGKHAYMALDYDDRKTPNDLTDDLVTLFNPWGLGTKEELALPVLSLENFENFINRIYRQET